MSKDFYEVLKSRRSIYTISRESTVSDERLKEIVEEAVKHAPTAFNSQSERAVVLLGEHHEKLWDITTETLRKIVPADSFASTEEKMNLFKAGYGTILFFSDQAVVEHLQKEFALYADKFPVWAEQATGILQYAVWTSLAAEDMGATLQHYNPLIDDEVKEKWNIPSSWKLTAQMPFGKPTAPAGEKEFSPIEDRVLFIK
ncbi:MAG: nitroreductase family protein [Bacillus sp. (in: firmicutes)]